MNKTVFLLLTFFTFNFALGGQDKDDCRSWMVKEILNKADTIYITNSNNLLALNKFLTKENFAELSATSDKGNSYNITITSGKFNSSDHVLNIIDTVLTKDENGKVHKESYCSELIDGQHAFGIDCTVPKSEIKTLSVVINGKNISVPDSAYNMLFEPHFQHSSLPIRAFETLDGKQLHLYLFGSDGAGAYMAKLVFNHSGYLATIAFEGDFGFACNF